MKFIHSFYNAHRQSILLFVLLLLISFVLFGRILKFGFIYDDSLLLWASKYHPEYFGIYWGHPSTVIEFLVLYRLFGTNALLFNAFGIFLRALSAFLGYLF